jgi:hypothetical protein
VISVSADFLIGCDVPKRDDLKYNVKLYDGKFETFGEVSLISQPEIKESSCRLFQISITITDINNKAPTVDDFESEISLYESECFK